MNNKKQIFLGIFLLMVAVGAIFYWSSVKVSESGEGSLGAKTTGVSFAEGEEVLEMLEILKSTNLDLGIFTDPVFQKLVDYSVELVPEPIGRDNPFLPLLSMLDSEN